MSTGSVLWLIWQTLKAIYKDCIVCTSTGRVYEFYEKWSQDYEFKPLFFFIKEINQENRHCKHPAVKDPPVNAMSAVINVQAMGDCEGLNEDNC